MELEDVDLTDPDLFQGGVPHATFKLLRHQAPVYWHEEADGPGFFAVTKHADLKHVSKHPDVFSSEAMGTLRGDPPSAVLAMVRNMMLNMDPPKHARYRALVNKAFTPRMVGALHGEIARIVGRIVDDVIERGECARPSSTASRRCA